MYSLFDLIINFPVLRALAYTTGFGYRPTCDYNTAVSPFLLSVFGTSPGGSRSPGVEGRTPGTICAPARQAANDQ